MSSYRDWAHRLADIHEAIYDIEDILKSGRFKLSDLRSDLKFAIEGLYGYRPEQADVIRAKISWVEDRIKQNEADLERLHAELEAHICNKPPRLLNE